MAEPNALRRSMLEAMTTLVDVLAEFTVSQRMHIVEAAKQIMNGAEMKPFNNDDEDEEDEF